MTTSMKYSMANPYFPENEIDWIIERFRHLLMGNRKLSMGGYVTEFEKEFAKYIDFKIKLGI